MSGYQRKELQILGGSWNLLPPGDKVPKTDYLLAQNWRVDKLGALVSRAGYPQKFSIAGAAHAHSAAIFGGVEGTYYIGANAVSGANPGNLYYNLSGSPIASGFDGNRIAMVPLNDWMYVMNRAVQGRHNGSVGWQSPWTITAPASACTPAAGSADSAGPSGTYNLYVTYETSDQTLESNPGPVSASVTVSAQDIDLTGIPTSSDSRVGKRNIYATGGTLGAAYLVLTINDNTTTTGTITISDGAATNNGVTMPTTNDAPPAAAGMVGPYFSRLIAFSTTDRPNRLFWTDPGLPQYWPGAADAAIGNWVDVGSDGEAIVWATIHTNVLIIYKERSIWRLVGDPDNGYLEQMYDGLGLVSQWGVVSAGSKDYFVGPNGLYLNTLDTVKDITDPIRPLFTDNLTNAGALTKPGAILPATQWYTNSLYAYAVALGYAMGKLYISYAEQATPSNTSVLLVYHEGSGRWFYHRNGLGTIGFQGFIFDGIEMVGLTGNGASAALGYNVDDFRAFYNTDPGTTSIECVYQSHYEDGGQPDNQKVWIELVVDYELAGDTPVVSVGYDNGTTALASVGSLTGTGRQQKSFALGTDGVRAKNISVAIDVGAVGLVIIHNVYLYYYEEARLALAAATLPIDLGVPNVKQAKELALDIDNSGAVTSKVYTDLPGNALAVRQTLSLATGSGRALWKIPFSTTEGYLYRVALSSSSTFRLYGARLLVRPVGTYIEAYEAAAGFVWDSQEMSLDSGITHIPRGYAIALASLPIKRFREISVEIESFNSDVTMNFLTDLPGESQQVRQINTINTGTAGRRFVRVPLPGGTSNPIEGRMCRVQFSGSSKFILYGLSVEVLAVGVYVEAYEAAGGAVYDSREMDFGIPDVKEARELELDIETSGSLTWQVLSDLTAAQTGTVSTTGRQKALFPLTLNAANDSFVDGRLLRLILTGTSAYRLYGARLRVRKYGFYLSSAELATGALWDTTALDLGTQQVKQLRELELEIAATGPYTVTVYTDLPNNTLTARAVFNQSATAGRAHVRIPLAQGNVPDNYIFGRLVRVTITGAAAFKLFGARIHARPIGVYVESYEAGLGAVWDSTPSDLGSPQDKTFDQVRFEMDSDGIATLNAYTDLPGEVFVNKASLTLTSGPGSRHWANATLPAYTEGRSIRLLVNSTAGFRIYRAQVRHFRVGRYLAAAAPGGADAFNTLEFDFRSERLKAYKRVEIDMRADGPVTAAFITEQTGQQLTTVWTTTLSTSGRQPLVINLPPGIRGRLLRISLTSSSAARIYRLRAWARPLNEPGAPGAWAWDEYPIEESDVLPQWTDLPVDPTPPQFSWADLPVPPTPPEWQWAPFPVAPTEPQWFWAKILSVEETPETWTWVDVPFTVEGTRG